MNYLLLTCLLELIRASIFQGSLRTLPQRMILNSTSKSRFVGLYYSHSSYSSYSSLSGIRSYQSTGLIHEIYSTLHSQGFTDHKRLKHSVSLMFSSRNHKIYAMFIHMKINVHSCIIAVFMLNKFVLNFSSVIGEKVPFFCPV